MAREKSGAETINYEEVDVVRRAERDDRRARPGRVHRRRRHGGARPRPRCTPYDRVKQAIMLETVGPRVARGDPVLPQRRHGFSARRLRRIRGQELPFGAIMNKGLTMKSANARPALHEAAA